MDLSKAFDTLNHQILLNKSNFYGIAGIALEWFSSYLTGRQQFVEIDGVSSDSLTIDWSVTGLRFWTTPLSHLYERYSKYQQII